VKAGTDKQFQRVKQATEHQRLIEDRKKL